MVKSIKFAFASSRQSINQSILSTVTPGVETFRMAKLVTIESPFSKTRLFYKLDYWFESIGDCIWGGLLEERFRELSTAVVIVIVEHELLGVAAILLSTDVGCEFDLLALNEF